MIVKFLSSIKRLHQKVEYKQVLVVRKDLGMGIGKIAAQVAHASVLGVEYTRSRNYSWVNNWFKTGQAKIVVKVNSLDELKKIEKHAKDLDLPVCQIQDSGLTQIEPGTITCIGIGPAPTDQLDKVTTNLKLL